ncbi:MAG: PqqD family peptide modification chaperone [Methanoregula sp.]
MVDQTELGSIPVANPAVISQEDVDGGLVLVNCDTGSALALNATGTMVWKQIDGRRTPSDITAAVSSCFRNVPDKVGEDILSLLHLLAEEGFIGYEIMTHRKG